MQVHLKTLGCRLNEAELEQWSRQFQAGGAAIVNNAASADLVVINSCAVTADAARKSRQLVRRLRRQNPTAKLVLSGCYATLEPAAARAETGADLVIANADKDRLVELTQAAFPTIDTAPDTSIDNALTPLAQNRSRAFVKVQDGCRYRCTFCIVTTARGAERSRAVDDIVDEINQLHAQGLSEAVLTGVHLGGYGSDTHGSLTGLISAVLRDTDLPRLRLGSLEPWELKDDFFALFSNPRLLPHLHLPLQSGCDATLKRMARRTRSADFTQLVEQARHAIPDLNITTDVIVGFPGETEREWRQSVEFIEGMEFGQLHIFPYSPRTGTAAARFPDPVDRATQGHRVEQLQALNQRLKRATLTRHLGREFPILWEHSRNRERDYQRGYTPNFLRVMLPTTAGAAPEPLATHIRPARLLKISDDGEAAIAELPHG